MRKLIIASLIFASDCSHGVKQQSEPKVVICESGSFETPSETERDPYLVSVAECNLNNSQGERVKVILID